LDGEISIESEKSEESVKDENDNEEDLD